MVPVRRTALVAGILYLVTFVASIPAVFLLDPVLNDAHYIVGSGSEGRVVLGCLLDIVNAVACVGTAVALFPIVRRQNEGIALGFVTSRMYEAAVIMIGVVSLLGVVTLRRDGADGADTDTMVSVGRALVAIRDWTFLLGPSLAPGFNALLLGYLMYRSGLVPRVIPLMGLVGGPLIIAATVARMFAGQDRLMVLAGIATVPIFLWELSLGLYLTFRGFRPSPITAGLAVPA
ncbi:DUF4386 domain-containing protein [Nocardioides sp. CER19]|uniref:DUF4386 domain-containing protein n=1 Tax=Nocardioides sp. CER19 TaxID=3038538 RepID=UPI00244CB0CE|nr:DUF4386 domain-containing protein [Nocardioides sp. CER19]MDH2415838.1 DUF4386 domain-containing protein [Nocardioides sp. CER19]